MRSILNFNRKSLGTTIFTSMLGLVLAAFLLIALVTFFQYKEQINDYNEERLERKESSIRKMIDFFLRKTTYELKTDKIPLIFKDEIFEIASVQGENLTLYDLEGNPLITSTNELFDSPQLRKIPKETLAQLEAEVDKRYVNKIDGQISQQLSYSYVNDPKYKPLAILEIQYEDSESFINKEMREILWRLVVITILIVILAIVLAYFLAKYITKTLKTVEDNIKETQLDKRNEKIETTELPSELITLVNAYNGMIDQLEGSAAKLAQNEREAAWREMAKQVAHEIKNPLTPMRLTVQSFERRFDPQDPEVNVKIKEYSKTLIQQIDTMSSIASAFSNFADMPAQQTEMLDVPKIVKLSLDIFNEQYIHFASNKEEIHANFDRTQLIRVVTNLVKNAVQATKLVENPKILVDINDLENDVEISVSDNGVGITEENRLKIFEPKFTTKSSGMGLGLAMVKNIVETYDGSITFTTEEGKGTVFRVIFPK
ncbi:sensor histidine kinase [Dokdonia sp. Hel_I_53]|uniref:sensor histidine kinase n=1 Tax=Dokdonia sp. Hel_I_53 TaxID=1566287 RepID=UPI001198D6CC|nr:ATP-binding protein [Dokdonia sp. Hel_I_53]TVZ52543.1 HAMP domain-containing protein [Dokdonia sp. Hel_I_53]